MRALAARIGPGLFGLLARLEELSHLARQAAP